MARLTDQELSSLIANALHRSGPAGDPERSSLTTAYARAAFIINAIHGAGAIVVREERRFEGMRDALDSGASEAERGG